MAFFDSPQELFRDRFRRAPAPPDPVRLNKRAGIPHYGRHMGRVLMADSYMPITEHAGKIMRAVPADFLAWVDAQPWADTWADWQPVRDYMSRHPDQFSEITQPDGSPPTTPPLQPAIILLEPLVTCQPTRDWRWTQQSRVHSLPGYTDYLHAFALGALRLPRYLSKYVGTPSPHYLLNGTKHAQALAAGAQPLTPDQTRALLDDWRQFHANKPRPKT